MMKSIIAIACIVAAILFIGMNNNSAFGGNDPADPKPASVQREPSFAYCAASASLRPAS